jgi:hypothetical protein
MRLTEFAPRRLNELSPATLASYKKKAGAAATAADAAGDTKTGNQRFSGIVKATKKQFDQDAKRNNTNEAAPVYYDTATGKPLPPEARFDPNTGKPLPGVSSAPQAAAAPAQGLAPTKPGLPTPNKSKEAAYAAANKAKAAAPAAAPVAAPVAAPAPVAAAPAAAKPPRDTSKSIYDGDTGELTAYGAELKAKEKVDRQAAYAAAEANKAKAAPAAPITAPPAAAPAAPTTTGMFQPQTTSPATNPAGKKVDIVQAAKAATAAGGNPEAAAIAAMKAKNPKLAAMMAQAGLDDQGNDIAAAPAAAPVAEGKADYNFDIEDLKRLERIRDLATLKTQAMMLISKPSAKPMRPEKVEWFRNALEKMNSPLKVIKLMYDLLLSGEGHSVVGSRSSMNPNSYRQRFNEQDVAEDALAGMKRLAGIASAQTQSTLGQRQYRHMPTAVQPR